MTLQQLIYFQTICQYKNFRRAAEELHVSQPCLSSAISKLEQELNVYLFDRRGRHVELTKLGKYYLERVSGALEELNAATEELKRFSSATHGRVDVAFCGPLTRELVPRLIREFLADEINEKITFEITQMTTPLIIQNMKSDRFDVAFCTQIENKQGLTFIPIWTQELVVIVPKDHPLAFKDKVKLAELTPYPFISYIVHSGVYNLIIDLLQTENITPNITYTAHDEESISALVGAGFGVSIVANMQTLIRPDTKVLHIDHPGAFFDVSLVYPPNQYTTPAVARFIKYAKDRLQHAHSVRDLLAPPREI